MMVMVTWRAPKVGADLIEGYRVSTRSTPGGVWEQKDAGMALKFTYEGLTNGVEYDIRVCPYDGSDWRESETRVFCGNTQDPVMLPGAVPALPIFGAVALGAGLLAAGRGRLRRRELRAGRVQRQINR